MEKHGPEKCSAREADSQEGVIGGKKPTKTFLLLLSSFIPGIDVHEKTPNFPKRKSPTLKEERKDTKEFMSLS